MSNLLARIMLVIFMIPAAGMIYTVIFVIADRNHWVLEYLLPRELGQNANALSAGIGAWAFISLYWTLVWRKSIRWNAVRIVLTVVAVIASVAIGSLCGFGIRITLEYDRSFAAWAGTVIAPLSWLIITTLLWRETTAERAQRIGDGRRLSVACPTCGYNLTGLRGTACPECGSQFTLDELLASRQESSGVELL